jgi:hypothetical protein
MPRFSKYFQLHKTQHELDFVDVSNEYDTPVYVDPYAIQTRDDLWADQASEKIRNFFVELLHCLRTGQDDRAINIMTNLREPKETFLGVSSGEPNGRGVGKVQAAQMIHAIRKSTAFATGMLDDLAEMALYVEGIGRDKISDLTTNIIRDLLTNYTKEQCKLLNIPVKNYASPPAWDSEDKNWKSFYTELPHIDGSPVLLVPKYIVRRQLSIDSQDFFNKQITNFLVEENLSANTSLVKIVKKKPKVFKKDVRKQFDYSKEKIAEFVKAHPEVLNLYKELAKKHGIVQDLNDEDPSVFAVCGKLAEAFAFVETGPKDANKYHDLCVGALTALFHPDLILPKKEWEIDQGRKRIDLVFTNACSQGFFAQQRDNTNVGG